MKKSIFFLLFIFCFLNAFSQSSYSGKVESNYLLFQSHLVKYELAVGATYESLKILDENCFEIYTSHGIKRSDIFYFGLGLLYINGAGQNVLGCGFDFEIAPVRKKVTPLVNLRLGNTFLLTPGRGRSSFDFGLLGGVGLKVDKKKLITLKTGFRLAQESSFIPLSLGFRF